MFLIASVILVVIGDMNIKMMVLEHNVYYFPNFKITVVFFMFFKRPADFYDCFFLQEYTEIN